jgi:hypothetical protein
MQSDKTTVVPNQTNRPLPNLTGYDPFNAIHDDIYRLGTKIGLTKDFSKVKY